jgi:predicted small metal-binding protein
LRFLPIQLWIRPKIDPDRNGGKKMANLKKDSDAVMNSPMRTPTGSGFGSSEDSTANRLSVERKGHEALERKEGNLRFRCSDVGDPNCKWEAQGRSEDELMPQIERHGRDAHNINRIDDNMRQRIRSNIRAA